MPDRVGFGEPEQLVQSEWRSLKTDLDSTKSGSQRRAAASPYEKLLELAHQRALKGKGGLAASVAEMCLASKASLTERELQLAFEILRLLVDQVEVDIRRHIADYLADRNDVPADLIRRLSRDDIGVAYPILAHSTLLSADDLLAVIADCSMRHRQAVAIRPNISQSITDRLVAFDEIEVLTTLLCNETADIGEKSMRHLVEQSLDIESFREPLAHRPEMTRDMARRMYIWAGDSLRGFIIDEFGVDPDNPAGRDENVTTADFGASQGDGDALRSPSMQALIDAGDLDGVERALAEALRLPVPAVSMILNDSGPETIAIAVKAAGLEPHDFGEILCRVLASGPADEIRASTDYQRAMRYFRQLDYSGAVDMLGRLRLTAGQRRRA